MLPEVDYAKLEDENFFGSGIVDLEYNTMSSLSDFIEALKHILIREKMIQLPEIMVSYLCAYLGFFLVVGLGKNQAEKLEPAIKNLMETQAEEVYRIFLKYHVKKTNGPNENLQTLRDNSPGSIAVQTIRLGKVIWDTMEELRFNRDTLKKQTELFCPQEDFLQLLVNRTAQNIHKWKEQFDIKPILHAVNQITIQIAWIMGYLAYLDQDEPTRYLDYGLPMIKMYGEAGEHVSNID